MTVIDIIYQLYFASMSAQYKNIQSIENTKKYKLYTDKNIYVAVIVHVVTVIDTSLFVAVVPLYGQ